MFGLGRNSTARKSVDSPATASSASGNVPKSPSVIRPKNKFSSKHKTVNADDTMNIDWVSDKAAKACVMCEKRFHTFKRRRHHCRQCGRVVCNACSLKRLVLQAEHFQGPQRVCDGCYFTLAEKKQAKQHALTVREKEEQLLNASSYISESLLRVFLLDGSAVTVSYDDCSTAADLTERICFSVQCALFEVQQDIRDRDQYSLVHGTDTLVDIIARWALKASKTVKLVLPLYNFKSAQAGHTPATSAMRMLRVQGSLAFETQQSGLGPSLAFGVSPNARSEWEETWHDDISSQADSYRGDAFSAAMEESGMVAHSLGTVSNISTGGKGLSPNGGGSSSSARSVTGKPSPLRLDSDPHSSVDGEEHRRGQARQTNNDKLELQALQKKYDLLKNIHSRQTMHRSSLTGSNIASGAHLDSLHSTNKYRGESYDLFDEKPFNGGKTSPVPCVQDDNSLYESSICENDDDSGDDEVSVADTVTTAGSQRRGLFGFVSRVATNLRSPNKERSSSKDNTIHRSTSRDASEKLSPNTDARARDVSPIAKRSVNAKSAPLRDRSDSMMSTGSVRAGPEMILLSPKDIQSFVYDVRSSSADFQQIVRTFFHQTSSVENFLVKFQGVIRTLMKKEELSLSEATRIEVRDSNNRMDFGTADDTGGLTNVFEMTWALEGLYAYVLDVAEDWSNEVRSWLLTLFRKSLSPPILRHASLKCLTQCLQQMELLHSPQAISAIQGCVDQLFDPRTEIPLNRMPALPIDGTDRDLSSMRTSLAQNRGIQALDAMRRISFALSVLGDDLLPAFPIDVGLLNMCLLHTTRIVRSEVLDFFIANKHALSLIDVLTILSFAEHQRQILSHIGRLGTDLPILQELEQEALRTYLAITDSNLRQVISRVHASDERAVPQEGNLSENSPGLLTNWPSELLHIYGDHFASISRYVQPKTREIVWKVILDSLPDFVLRQKAWISKVSSGNSSATSHSLVERLCAHINNHQGFADALENKLDRLSADLDDAAVERVTSHYHRISALFISHAEFSLQLLIRQVVAELQKTIRVGLFRSGWDSSVQIVHTAKRALMTYKTSLFTWLRDAQFASSVVGAAALSICDLHVELIITSNMTVTANFLDRLQEDFNLWQDILQNYIEYMRSPADLLDAQASWRLLITALSMDTRSMQSFVRNDMFPTFGTATMKIWLAIMQMRGDGKQVVDALVDAIMHDWSPKSITPKHSTQSFVAKLKCTIKLPKDSIFIM